MCETVVHRDSDTVLNRGGRYSQRFRCPKATASELVAMCERVATQHLGAQKAYVSFPNRKLAASRISLILKLLADTMALVDFENDMELAEAFWRDILADSSGVVPTERWEKFARLTRSVVAAHHFLRRYSDRDAFQSRWIEDTRTTTLETNLLKQFACVFYHVLGCNVSNSQEKDANNRRSQRQMGSASLRCYKN